MSAKPGTRNVEPAAFVWPVRVYHEDTDAGGVVYYASYLRFLERARTEWLRARGFGQAALAAEHRVAFVVRSLSIEYLSPARYDDLLEVTVEPREIGASRLEFAQRVARGEEQLARARVEVACVNTETLRPARIPAPVAARIKAET
ncbi:MAG TPA: tol-pal system-associated acyl-CoA thioesterase [Burkholderiales bacterium]|nr:tol-pal system-associated acyl-CoA thioesterase [Burkholderiales bacterium]